MAMTIDEMIAVLQAAKEGKTIEGTNRARTMAWAPVGIPAFNFGINDYRVEPPVKVKKWQWIYESNKSHKISVNFYPDEESAKKSIPSDKVFKAEWTMIEVDA